MASDDSDGVREWTKEQQAVDKKVKLLGSDRDRRKERKLQAQTRELGRRGQHAGSFAEARVVMSTLGKNFNDSTTTSRGLVEDTTALAKVAGRVSTLAKETAASATSITVDWVAFKRGIAAAAAPSRGARGEFDWSSLGKQFAVFFRSAPSIEFMAGAINVEGRKKPSRARASAKRGPRDDGPVMDLNKKPTAAQVRAREEAEGDGGVGRRVDELNAELNRLMETSAESVVMHGSGATEKRLRVWETLLDPRCFSWTVENIFYFAFLVKQHQVELGSTSDGDLVFRPCIGLAPRQAADDGGGAGAGAGAGGPAAQDAAPEARVMSAIASIDPGMWEDFVRLLEISEPAVNLPSREGVTPPGMLPLSADVATAPGAASTRRNRSGGDTEGERHDSDSGVGGGGAGAGAGAAAPRSGESSRSGGESAQSAAKRGRAEASSNGRAKTRRTSEE
mmetsp:Transcript_19396/g.68680  ORF Transcript_19396/g.68680 Transcript_19396/m.68680 type:complete len:450 (-) Transcript_19396:49-1398(-)|eukprot:CAMPEP_0203812498 /NCGR_PEP_ID=MMETSP0115-20131106/4184_1 /ASSEMBLY_ACC=CAM_ASM_000227 /TAXON_ID=33651 /ORGANISM="Bicosoecid sp, Strain ms1" /LENGTH=449 /DNA_ID=CAMNT_0050721343 /DNA_START=250 /DNA_END=1599 /DNA_ORIENTATION=-